jgi:CRISPR system Cascade subunit CasB
MTNQITHPFINYLQSLAEGQNRGALASLRRGLGQPPGTVADMYRYVEPHLGKESSAGFKESAFYLVAALFALHPSSTGNGNMGTHMRASDPENRSGDALDRRFTALLAAHSDDLPDYLRQAISFLKSKDVAINWSQLLWDLQNWNDENRRIQKQWARDFWGRRQPNESSDTTIHQGE